MKNVYILLSRSRSLFSRCIRRITGNAYTHVSIALSPEEGFYSFGRKRAHIPFPAGFVRESPLSHPANAALSTDCLLLSIALEDEAYASVANRLRKMENCASIYHYDLWGRLIGLFGRVRERRRYFFCTQFVGDVLSRNGAVCLPKPASLMLAEDYTAMRNTQLLYAGTFSGLCAWFSAHRHGGKLFSHAPA